MSSTWPNLFVVGLRGRTVTLNSLGPHSTCDEFRTAFFDQEGQQDDVYFIFGAKVIEGDHELHVMGLHDEGTITAIARSPGGADDELRIDRSGELEVVDISNGPPCCITICNNAERAIMPCGHYFSCEGMTQYVRSLLENKKYEVTCPDMTDENKKCGRVFEWKHVSLVGAFTPAERNDFEVELTYNRFRYDILGFKCPHCESYLVKQEGVRGSRVRCIVCKGELCCKCQCAWVSSPCPNCTTTAISDRLANCPPVPVSGGFEVPSVRMCPICSSLVEYKATQGTACKHVWCLAPLGCSTEICFSCLSVRTGGSFPDSCGNHSFPCPIAARQNA